MSNVKSTTSGGTSIGLVLFLIFLVLKLTGTITWSWFWVIFPLWAGFAFGLAIAGLFLIIGLIVAAASR